MRPILALLLVPVLAFGALADEEPPDLAAGNTAFACDLYGHLKTEQGNLFVSPYSISTCLAMVREGAAGKTAAEMDTVFRFPAKGLGPACSDLAGRLTAPMVRDGYDRDAKQVPAYAFAIANRLFGQRGFAFRQPFLTALEQDYKASLEQLDMQADPLAAREHINGWVEDQTQDRIKDLLPEGTPTTDTRLVLVNAIYFKSQWATPFRKRKTVEEPFHRLDGSTVEVALMANTKHFRYAETDDLQVLEMPYKSGACSMVVLLPKAKDGLPALESKLTPEALEGWIGGLGRAKVAVTFPRFEFTTGFDLTKTLRSMGMPTAFSSVDANFSKMTEKEPQFIGIVVHKAFVKVDEEGTEAAAATAVGMRGGGRPRPEEPKVFRADHPFLFLIRHQETNTILFMGRVVDPG